MFLLLYFRNRRTTPNYTANIQKKERLSIPACLIFLVAEFALFKSYEINLEFGLFFCNPAGCGLITGRIKREEV